MSDLYGFTGKILYIDLTNNEVSSLNTEDYVPEWVGGRGIGAKIHWDMVGPGVKAFDPENVLTFMTGSGTGIIDSRLVVQAVSPLGHPVESYYRSTIGSHFGAELKHAGWDGIVVVGAASALKYVLIENDKVEIRDGSDLALMDTHSTQQNLWERHSRKHRCMLIGPAGENLVRDSIIMADDHNATGLGGLGAVMGSKKLKAIVCRGTLPSPKIADPKALLQLRKAEADLMVPNPGVGAAAGSMIELAGKNGECRVGMAGCFGCVQPCGYAVRWNDGFAPGIGALKCGEFICDQAALPLTGEYVGRNHYKKIIQQGLLGITGQPSYREVVQDDINGVYDEPITLLHNGVITEADLGIEHQYGTPEFYDEFNRGLAYRTGKMWGLGEGMAKFCYETLGTPEAIYDYQRNGLRAGNHGGCPGFVITLYRIPGLLCRMTSTVNSADQRGQYHYLMPMYEPFAENATEVGADLANWGTTYAPAVVKFMQDFKSSMDLVDRCFFHLGTDSMGAYQHLFQQIHTAITGQDYRYGEEETYYSERLWLFERSILMRQGHTRDDDQLFDAAYEERAQYGVTYEKMNACLDEYYALRGIDPATGYPKKSEYRRLGLEDVMEELETTYGIVLPE